METNTFNKGKYQIIYCVLLFLLASVTLPLMLWYATHKVVIVTAEDAEVSADESLKDEQVYEKTFTLNFSSDSRDGWIHFPCPASMVLSDISVTERPDLQTVTVEFSGASSDFFMRNAPFGDFAQIENITESSDGDKVKIILTTKQIVFAESKMADHEFVLKLSSYKKNRKMVLVDPMYGGNYTGTCVGSLMEKDINQAIANKVRELAKEKEYYVVLTKSCDINLSTMERMDIIDSLSPDCYLGISLNTDMENQNNFGMKAVYNDEYYRDDLENVDFADLILTRASESSKNRANELEKAGENYAILKALDIPAAQLYAGTITNTEEAELLKTDNYITKIAEGIVAALDEVFIQ